MVLFTLGLSCIAALLGFLVGASESPVAGIALTSTFGIVATGLALHQRTAASTGVDLPKIAELSNAPSEIVKALRSLGMILVVFAIAFSIGMSIGVTLKVKSHEVDAQPKLFWQGAQAPSSARKAIDWLLVHKRLRDLGYTDAQILEIYKLESQRKKGEDENPLVPPVEQLLSPLFSGAPPTPSPGRFGGYIAMDPKLTRREGDV